MRPLLAVVVLLLLAAPARAAQNDLVVSPTGTGTACTPAAPCPLAYAVGFANGNGTADFDYLHLGEGVYGEPVSITSGNVTVQGFRAELRAAATDAVVRVDAGADQNVALLDLTVAGAADSADGSAAVELASGNLQMLRSTVSMAHDAPGTVPVRVTGGLGQFGAAFEGERFAIKADTPAPAVVAEGGGLRISGATVTRTVPSTQPLVSVQFGTDIDASELTAVGDTGTLVAVDASAADPQFSPHTSLNSVALSGGATGLSVTGPASLYLRHLTQRQAGADPRSFVFSPGDGAITGELRDSIIRDPTTLGGATLTCAYDDVLPGVCPDGSEATTYTPADADLFTDGSLRPRPGGPGIDSATPPTGAPAFITAYDAAGDLREAPGTCGGAARRDRGAYELQRSQQAVTISSYPTRPVAGQPSSFKSFAQPEEPEDTVRWDWGDGTSSIGRDPVKSWDAPGTYTISVTYRSSEGGCDSTASRSITVEPAPAAGPSPSPSPSPSAKPRLRDYLRLPATKRCRRSVRVKLRARTGVKALRVKVGRRPARTVKRSLRVKVRKRRVRIAVTVVLDDGTRLTATRTYRRCRG